MHNKGFRGECGYDEKSRTILDFMKMPKVWGQEFLQNIGDV
jgi:hypothetical protein